ncbi:MAG: glycosyltransferase [Caldilineaceae bacterium]|nr:glycosyltransferase [Caldilineaceae bacterium]
MRIYNLLRGVAQRHEVTLISFNDQPGIEPDLAPLQAFCEDVCVVPWTAYRPDSLRARLHFFNPKPRSVIDTFSPHMVHAIEDALRRENFDLVIASQIDAANHYRHAFRQIPAIFEEAEVSVLYEQYARSDSPWRRFRYGLTWSKHRHHLASVLRQFQRCTVVSERERQLVSALAVPYCAVDVIPNCVDVESYAPFLTTPTPSSLIFTGAFTFSPNYEGMCWFVREVFPRVHAAVPDAHLTITGNHADLPLPNEENVTLTGFVDDVRPLVARSWASVVPLHTGGGTRLKILESMALGTPVIATSKGAEGLDAQPGVHLLVADTPQEMADATLRLFHEPGLRQQLSANGYELVREKYNWATVMPHFLELVESVAERRLVDTQF